TRTRDEWFERISAAGATVAACQEIEEVVEHDPQVKHRSMIWDVSHPIEGRVRQWGFPIQVRGQEATLQKFAPAAGEDTEAILTEVGYDRTLVEELRQTGAVNRADGGGK